MYTSVQRGRGRVVGIATRYGLDGPGVESQWGRFSAPVQTRLEAHPASCKMDIWSLPGDKTEGSGVDTHLDLAPRLNKE